MKKTTAFLIILPLLFFAFSLTASAEEGTTDKILNDFSAVIPDGVDITLDGDTVSEIGFEAILKEIIAAVKGEGGRTLGFLLMLLGFSILIALAEAAPIDDAALRSGVGTAIFTIAALSVFASLYEVCESVRVSLLSVVDFFASVIPIFTVISVSSGAITTAAAQSANMNITLAMLEKFCTGALLPCVFAIFALSLVGSGDGSGANVARGVKSVFMWGVGIISTVLAATVAMQSVVASAADNAALRAARYAASGMIPIVGSTVASALATLGGGLAFIKSSVGASAVAVILVLSLSPLISLLLYRLAFSVSVIFLEFVGSAAGVRCFGAFRSALDALIAVYSISTLVCIVEVVVFVKGGAAL